MVGRLFGSSWCLYVVVGPSSPYRRLLEIVGSDLSSFLSFRPAGGGTWAIVGCQNDVVRLAHFSQRSGQHIRRCDVCECRVLLPEEVRIGERTTCPSLGSRDGVASDSEARHVSSGRGVPTGIVDRKSQLLGIWRWMKLSQLVKGVLMLKNGFLFIQLCSMSRGKWMKWFQTELLCYSLVIRPSHWIQGQSVLVQIR